MHLLGAYYACILVDLVDPLELCGICQLFDWLVEMLNEKPNVIPVSTLVEGWKRLAAVLPTCHCHISSAYYGRTGIHQCQKK